jgi:cytochrome oxidase assembly protein ShyY1
MKRLPLLPTLLVAVAVAMMIGLGIWQLQRARWKEGLLAQYAAASTLPPIAWPTLPLSGEPPLFRHASGLCLQPVGFRAVAGRNNAGESGYAHIADCRTGAEGPGMSVDIGWSPDPNAGKTWKGGKVSGVIVPDSRSRMRLVSAVGLAGLQASAPPSIENVPVPPSQHRQYAATWFGLAITALLIYALALRRRWREGRK